MTKKLLITWTALCLLIGVSVLTMLLTDKWFIMLIADFIIGAPLIEYMHRLECGDGKFRSAEEEIRKLRES